MFPFVFGILIFISLFFVRPFVPFPPFPGPDPCSGVSHQALAICTEYCETKNCDEDEPSRAACRKLRFQFTRVTGTHFFPCDVRIPGRRTATSTPEQATPTTEPVTPTEEPEVTETETMTPELETPTATTTETPTATATTTPIETVTATSTAEGIAFE